VDHLPIWAYLVGTLLASGVLSAVLSWHVAVQVARESGNATRQQAIETERLKLRYQIAYRRVVAFDDGCARLMRAASFKEVNIQDAANAATDMLTQAVLLSSKDLTQTQEAIMAFTRSVDALKDQVIRIHGNEADERTLVPLLETMRERVCVLCAWVDEIAAARIARC
jgi:hypothetical protein